MLPFHQFLCNTAVHTNIITETVIFNNDYITLLYIFSNDFYIQYNSFYDEFISALYATEESALLPHTPILYHP